MKPTGATKEAMDQAVELIDGASNWSDVEYLVTPKVAALFDERERLREALRLVRATFFEDWMPSKRAIELIAIIDAALNEVEG